MGSQGQGTVQRRCQVWGEASKGKRTQEGESQLCKERGVEVRELWGEGPGAVRRGLELDC